MYPHFVKHFFQLFSKNFSVLKQQDIPTILNPI